MKEEMENNKEELIKKKCNFFFRSNLPIHVKYSNGFFDNGMIEFVGSDFIKLRYLEDGQKLKRRIGDYVFFLEIEDIEEYFPKEER